MPGIEIHDLVKTYRRGTVRALDGISLAVAPGEAVGVIGPNGAGKTTLMGCLLGFLRPDSGRITLDGFPPDSLPVRAGTGYLPERPALDRWRTGSDLLRFHHALARLDPARRTSDVAAALTRVGLPAEAGRRRIGRYSRGMLQRLGLAQAMLGRPRYLFLDEPTSGLDPGGAVLFRRLLGELRDEGAAIVLNSHHVDQVERTCTRVIFVRRGKIESTEILDAGTARARLLRVRLAAGGDHAGWTRDAVSALAEASGSRLADFGPIEAAFAVRTDDGAAALLAALVGAGHRVAEAVPEESRLERLFLDEEPS